MGRILIQNILYYWSFHIKNLKNHLIYGYRILNYYQ